MFEHWEQAMTDMTREAVSAGFYQSPGWGTTHPRVQILTVGQLLDGTARVDMPPTQMTFRQAGRVKDDDGPRQGELFG